MSLRVLHFRRMFSPLTEFFLYDPITEMAARSGVDAQVLCVVRMHKRLRPFPAQSLLSAPRFLHSQKLLGKLLHSKRQISEADRYLWPLLARMLRRRIERIKPDVVHAHFGPDACLVRPLTQRLGIPLVASFYGYDVSRLIHETWDAWHDEYQALFASAARLLGISDYVLDRLRDLGAPAEKLQKLHLGVKLERFTYRDPASDFDGTTVRCLHVGRLTAKKAPLHLIRALHQAQQQIEQRLELTIIGDGELSDACAAEVSRLGLQDQVHLLGSMSHERVVEELGRAHIYTQHCMVGPDGDTEGLGLSFVEASASGLPVVTTRHNGVPEIVLAGRTGLLGPEGDVDANARHLAELAPHPQRWTELGRAGREHVEREFSLDICVTRHIELLKSLAGR